MLQNAGIRQLTDMQQAAVARALDGDSFVLLSPTGSGKTLAYLLPLAFACDAGRSAVQAVVILPSRELAQQCEGVFRSLKSGLRSLCLHGGRPTMEEHRKLLEAAPQVVFATPGRLDDHLEKGNIDSRGISRLVIDEFDKCLELGFRDVMQSIAARLSRVRQLILTSATDVPEIPAFVAALPGPAAGSFGRLDFLSPSASVSSRIGLAVVPSPRKDKLETLAHLLSEIGGKPAIVFVAHRESAERVGHYLRQARFAAEVYHGGMEQEHRERALYKFRSGGSNVLVATDLAARGLDIPEVHAVVHYHLSANEEAFIHRCGRTARWTATGRAYLLLSPGESVPDYLPSDVPACDVERCPVRPMEPDWRTLYIGRGKKDKLSRGDVVGFLCKKGGLRSGQLGRVDVFAHHAYAAVRRECLSGLLRAVAGEKIKGMKTLVEEMKR